MEPLSPNDPLWKLMSKARPVVLRPNFTQNVMRAIRQEAQTTSGWAGVLEWLVVWQRSLMGAAAVAALAVLASVTLYPSKPSASIEVASIIPDAEMAAIADVDVSVPLDGLDHMDALVAMQDTSSLSDRDLQFLLY